MRLIWSTPWVGLSVVLVAELLLQLFPPTGVILMLFLAPMWSAVLTNLILLEMIRDAISNPARRALLVIPVVAYAGYAVFAIGSEFSYQALRREIDADNVANHHPLDVAKQALVMPDSNAAYEVAASSRIPVVYVDTPQRAEGAHQAIRMVSNSECDLIDTKGLVARVSKSPGNLGSQTIRNACVLTTYDDPAIPVMKILENKSNRSNAFVQAELRTFTAPNGARATAGDAKVLSWFPLPTIGCFLNDGSSSWDCFAKFVRTVRPVGDDSRSPARPLAGALGLQPWTTLRPKVERGPFRGKSIEVAADQLASNDQHNRASLDVAQSALKNAVTEALDALPGAIKSGFALPPDAWAVVSHADLLGGRAEELASWLTLPRAIEDGKQGLIITEATIAALPASDYSRISSSVAAAASSIEGEGRRVTSGGEFSNLFFPSFLVRLGDAGPAGVSSLTTILAHDTASPRVTVEQRSEPAILGLCRAGSYAGAAGVTAIQARLQADGGFPVERRALVTAAMAAFGRLGRPDLAEALSNELPSRRGFPKPPALTPNSPASDCRSTGQPFPLGTKPWLDPKASKYR